VDRKTDNNAKLTTQHSKLTRSVSFNFSVPAMIHPHVLDEPVGALRAKSMGRLFYRRRNPAYRAGVKNPRPLLLAIVTVHSFFSMKNASKNMMRTRTIFSKTYSNHTCTLNCFTQLTLQVIKHATVKNRLHCFLIRSKQAAYHRGEKLFTSGLLRKSHKLFQYITES
jgi:hypothetical protein